MKSIMNIMVFLGLVLVLLGINVIYNPSLLVPIIAGVLIVLGVALLFIGLIVRRFQSFMGGGMSSAKGGMFEMDGVRVIRK